MASYLITGASRGIGFAFVENISSNPANTVIGLVRNKAGVEPKIAALSRTNIHLIEGDLDNYDSLKSAAEATAKITGGSLDYLIANAAVMSAGDDFSPFSVLGKDPLKLETGLIDLFRTNCVGNIHLFNLFIPLILKGNVKKVIALSTGLADLELVGKYNIHENPPYVISKAALNMAAAKFSAEYSKDGVLFMSICPGVVDTGGIGKMSPEELQKMMEMVAKFQIYAPDFKGPTKPEDAVKDVLSVAEKASVANADGGSYVSHLGKAKPWI